MSIDTYIVAALGALIGGLVQGLTGFAFTIVAMSIWVWTLDPFLAAVLAVYGALFGQVLGIFIVRRSFSFDKVLPFIIGGLLGMPIGFKLLPLLQIEYLKLGLGLLLITFCPAVLFSEKLPRVTLGGKWLDGVIGLVGGILGVLAGLSGALPALWCVLRDYEKDMQRAILQYYNLTILSITATLYLAGGVVKPPMVPVLLVTLIILLIPVLLGIQLYKKINERIFRRVILILLTLSGMIMLASVWT